MIIGLRRRPHACKRCAWLSCNSGDWYQRHQPGHCSLCRPERVERGTVPNAPHLARACARSFVGAPAFHLGEAIQRWWECAAESLLSALVTTMLVSA